MASLESIAVMRADGGWRRIDKDQYDANPSAYVRCDENGVALEAKAAPKAPKEPVASELGDLRKAYKAAYGKGPSPKWDADTLREKIAAAPAKE